MNYLLHQYNSNIHRGGGGGGWGAEGGEGVAVTPYMQIHAYVSLQWFDFFSFKIYDRVEIVQYVNGQPILQNI